MKILIYGFDLFNNELRGLVGNDDILGILQSEEDSLQPEFEKIIYSKDEVPEYDYVIIFYKHSLSDHKNYLIERFGIDEKRIIHFTKYFFSDRPIRVISRDCFNIVKDYIKKWDIKSVLDYEASFAHSQTYEAEQLLHENGEMCCFLESKDDIISGYYHRTIYDYEEIKNFDLLMMVDIKGAEKSSRFVKENISKFSHIMITIPYSFDDIEEEKRSLIEKYNANEVFVLNLYWTRMAIITRQKKVDSNSHQMYVVTHKNEPIPFENDFYQTIYVGDEEVDFKYNDNSGDNIHKYNSMINELTALYWIWKNDKHEYVGINHYRRYFQVLDYNMDWNMNLPDESFFSNKLQKFDFVVAKRWDSFPNIQAEQIIHDVGLNTYRYVFDILLEELSAKDDDRVKECFIRVLNSTTFFPFNMFYARREMVNRYCEWLFPILINCSKKLDEYFKNEKETIKKRTLGFLAERMLSAWIMAKQLTVYELDVVKI